MAKVLQFVNGSTLYEAEPVKIERKKLYGYKEISALDSTGNECRQCYLDASGSILIPPGAVKLSALDEEGNTIERSEMILVDTNGNPPDSFDPVENTEKIILPPQDTREFSFETEQY